MMIGIAGAAFGSPLLFSVLFEDRHRRPLHIVMLNGYINEGERNSPLHPKTKNNRFVGNGVLAVPFLWFISEFVECAAVRSTARQNGGVLSFPFFNNFFSFFIYVWLQIYAIVELQFSAIVGLQFYAMIALQIFATVAVFDNC